MRASVFFLLVEFPEVEGSAGEDAFSVRVPPSSALPAPYRTIRSWFNPEGEDAQDTTILTANNRHIFRNIKLTSLVIFSARHSTR